MPDLWAFRIHIKLRANCQNPSCDIRQFDADRQRAAQYDEHLRIGDSETVAHRSGWASNTRLKSA
jgi:hypothetical protein